MKTCPSCNGTGENYAIACGRNQPSQQITIPCVTCLGRKNLPVELADAILAAAAVVEERKGARLAQDLSMMEYVRTHGLKLIDYNKWERNAEAVNTAHEAARQWAREAL